MLQFDRNKLKDKIYACWIGKNIGGTMGGPYECKTEIQDVKGFVTDANVALPNDDLDLQLVWLRAVEEVGPFSLDEKTLGEYWISYIPPHWNEYGICKSNMRAGLQAPLCGEYNNVWKHSNGAWIRTEVWACMAPGCPDVAMKYAWMDASVDHGTGEGTVAAVFVAAIEAAAFVINDLRTLIDLGLSKIPAESRMAKTIRFLLECRDSGLDWRETREKLVELNKDLGWFQAPTNVAFAMLGLLYGEGDFKKSMILAINCGDDTDCTAATLGSIFGIMNGTAGIPEDWRRHIGDNIVSIAIDKGSLYGLPPTCAALTDRVYNMIPVMLKANRAQVYLGDEDVFEENDVKRLLYDDRAAKELAAIPGMSVAHRFGWGECRVVYEGEPEIAPGESVHLKLRLRNCLERDVCTSPKHISLRWILPEGWSVSGVRHDYVIGANNRYSTNRLEIPVTLTAGENVSAANRVICEITSSDRPTAGLVPIVFLG